MDSLEGFQLPCNGCYEWRQSAMLACGDHEDLKPGSRVHCFAKFLRIAGWNEVILIQCNQSGLRNHICVKFCDLVPHDIEIACGIGIESKHVNHHSSAFQMPQEADSESMPLVRAFNQSWDIGDAEGVLVGDLHAAKVRSKCSKGV